MTPAEFAEQFINQTNQSIFLTGKAGTGKTTFLRSIVKSTYKQTVIVAPTGIAALNAGGQTIHSFFQLPFSAFIPEFVNDQSAMSTRFENKTTLNRHFRLNARTRAMYEQLELIIIDEVSMLRADLLDAIDWKLRSVRKNNEAFGGVQMLFIGDLFQLPPVVKPEEWQELSKHYGGVHFFHAQVLREAPPLQIELNKIFRQANQAFIDLLNNLRMHELSQEDQQLLATFVKPSFDATKESGYITLTTHNYQADSMNQRFLDALKTPQFTYSAIVHDDFPDYMYPVEEDLRLKVGAQVMFIKNDIGSERRFYNGKMAQVVQLDRQEIVVECIEDKQKITLEHYEWENQKYELSEKTGELEPKTVGTFVQYPIKLAWAITVHKSQGLTFDKAVLDVSQAFAPGQAYVALSRLRDLSGLVLLKPLSINGLTNDESVVNYAKQQIDQTAMLPFLNQARLNYLYQQIQTCFDWYECLTLWRIHVNSYLGLTQRSEKGKHATWAQNHLNNLEPLVEPAKKFIGQIGRILNEEPVNSDLLLERMEKAYAYFYPTMDKIYTSLLRTMLQLGKQKKNKLFLDELEPIEESMLSIVLGLHRARRLITLFARGLPYTRSEMDLEHITHYKISKIHTLKNELRQQAPSLMDFEGDVEEEIVLKSRKNKKSLKPKLNTFEQTLELFKSGKSVQEIAEERKFTETTIYGHLERLIKDEFLELKEVMTEAVINQLDEVFTDGIPSSLGEMRELAGDKYSWEDLRLYRANQLR